jgi:hypothetical protein
MSRQIPKLHWIGSETLNRKRGRTFAWIFVWERLSTMPCHLHAVPINSGVPDIKRRDVGFGEVIHPGFLQTIRVCFHPRVFSLSSRRQIKLRSSLYNVWLIRSHYLSLKSSGRCPYAIEGITSNASFPGVFQ